MLPIEHVRPAVKLGFLERAALVADGWWDGGWREYVSLCRHPELLSTMNWENPLFVVHPGFRGYYPLELEEWGIPPDSYWKYLERLRDAVRKAVSEGREIFVFTPTPYRKETLAAIGHPDGVILIPTIQAGVIPDGDILGPETHYFYEWLQANIKEAQICGEYGDSGPGSIERCLVGVGQLLPDIQFTRIEECIYKTGDRVRTLPLDDISSA